MRSFMLVLRLAILVLLRLLGLPRRTLLRFRRSAAFMYLSLSSLGSLCHLLPSLLAICTMVRLGLVLWSRQRCLAMKRKKGGSERLEDPKRMVLLNRLPLLARSLERALLELRSARRGLWMVTRKYMAVLGPRRERTGRAMAAWGQPGWAAPAAPRLPGAPPPGASSPELLSLELLSLEPQTVLPLSSSCWSSLSHNVDNSGLYPPRHCDISIQQPIRMGQAWSLQFYWLEGCADGITMVAE